MKTTKDYVYCESCDMFVDIWRYNHSIKEAGHDGCHWRDVTEEELNDPIKNCEENGCFEEEML